MKNLKDKIQSVIELYKTGNLLKAEKKCNELILKNQKVAFLYNLLGLILVAQKKISQAIQKYEKGIKIDPNFAILYNNLGLIYFEKKN